ncbi:MAG TPA: Maf family protein [Candidatus Polarisedimenticolia bacterium]|nr:Maf family protein [Candidatus Polarisedimenticolia bacterium]
MIPLDRPLILASASPRRSDLLRAVGLTFSVRPSHVEEQPRAGEEPEVFVVRMAREKAGRGRLEAPERCLILGCDTVVVLGSRILGKPRDRADGRSMLRSLAGRTHLVLSGVAVLLLPEERWAVGVSQTKVSFAPIPATALESYLDSGEYLDKAGAYALQGAAALFVERIHGSATNVIGLPLDLLPHLLREFGLWFPEA